DDGLLLETEAGRVELRPDGTIDENPSIPVHPYDETFVNFEPEILIAPSRVPYLVAGWTIEECLPSSNPCTPGEDQGIAGRYDADQWTLAYTDGIQFASPVWSGGALHAGGFRSHADAPPDWFIVRFGDDLRPDPGFGVVPVDGMVRALAPGDRLVA